MAIVDLVMPKLGESIMEATILHWNKKPGDRVKMDETMLEIATDKVDSEVPSTAEGIVEVLLYNENDVVPVGAVIAKIRSENGVEGYEAAPAEATLASVNTVDEAAPAEVPYQPSSHTVIPKTGGARFYSPLVLNIAANEGISLADLEKIPGTGNEGRVTKKDILQWVEARKEGGAIAPVEQEKTGTVAPETAVAPDTVTLPEKAGEVQEAPVYSGNVEVIEMDRMRKLIAKHMVDNKHTRRMWQLYRMRVTNMVLWRDKVAAFEKQEGKADFHSLFIEAIIKCIKKFPWLNASVDGDKIIVRKDINIHMATALPNSNLIVPVIQEADMLNLTGLAKKVNRLADAAGITGSVLMILKTVLLR